MKTAPAFLVMLLGAAAALPAVETESPVVFQPPQKYGAERYMAGWERNPFSIPAPAMAPPQVESQFKDLAIKSIFGPKDSPIFSLVNTKTHERLRLSKDKPTKDGIELKSFSLTENRRETSIEVIKGSESATLKYAVDYVPPTAGGVPGMPPMPGAPGMQGSAGRIRIPQIGGPAPGANRSVPGQTTAANRGGPAANAAVSVTVGGIPLGGEAGSGTENPAASMPRRRTLIPINPNGSSPSNQVVPLEGGATLTIGQAGAGTITITGPGASAPAVTPQTNVPQGEISPPIVRPPPSIYLDANQR